jgi:hypothetical protein
MVDATNGKVLAQVLVVSDFEAPTPGQQGRPKAIPGSFRALVYEMVGVGAAGR